MRLKLKKINILLLVLLMAIPLITGMYYFRKNKTTGEPAIEESRLVYIDECNETAFIRNDFYSGLDRIYTHSCYISISNVEIIIYYWVGHYTITESQLKTWLQVEKLYCTNGTSIIFYGLTWQRTGYGVIFRENETWKYFVGIPPINLEMVLDYCLANAD